MRRIALFLALLAATPAGAHSQWANGDPVPAWVKAACCGPEDVHHLRPDQVHPVPGGWKIDGYPDVIPTSAEQPSPDGEWWAFFAVSTYADGSTSYSRVYCFFGPFQGL